MPDPYFSELKFLGVANLDFIEVAVDAGLDVSTLSVVVYHPNGTVRTTNTLGATVNTIAGRDIYVIDTATSGSFDGLHKNGAVALVQDGTVVSFLSFDQTVTATEGPAVGTDSIALGGTAAGQSLETTDDGTSYSVQTSPNPGDIPCFLAGTLILTSRGYRPIETLRVGDEVMTLDQGLQPLIWAGSRALSLSAMADPELRPIRIPAGSLAPGLPYSDLYLSPNHCLALDHPACGFLFYETQVLAPVKTMLGFRGIGHRPCETSTVYYHLLFECHQVILANGFPSESLYPGEIAIAGFADKERIEILSLLDEMNISGSAYGPTARNVLKPYEVAVLQDYIGMPNALSPESLRLSSTA